MTQSHCSKTELTLHHQGLQDQRSHHHHRFSMGIVWAVWGQNVIISLPPSRLQLAEEQKYLANWVGILTYPLRILICPFLQ